MLPHDPFSRVSSPGYTRLTPDPHVGNLLADQVNAIGSAAAALPAVNRPGQVLFASLIGTAIEFFDFYIYATAAVLVFPHLFFPASDPASATLASLATFAIAFFARPVGSAFFGHFGDRIGRRPRWLRRC